jgi:RNA polymerase sigma-70 factor (ECF subfamily)
VSDTAETHRDPSFPLTRWTEVMMASGDGPGHGEALRRLCEAYWYPLYAYVRRSGRSREDAEDLTQGFFASLLSHNSLSMADRARGRLRTFLLGSLKNHMANDVRHNRAQKRGGGDEPVSLDALEAESRFEKEDSSLSPDALFARRWALDLFARVLEDLRTSYESKGQGDLFTAFAPHLMANTDSTLEGTADQLGITVSNAKVSLHRMRLRYRQALHDHLAATVEDPAEIESELASLREALRSTT